MIGVLGLNYGLIVIIVGVVAATIIALLANSVFGKQTYASYSAQFRGYSPTETIKLETLDDMKANVTLAKESIISCRHVLISGSWLGAPTVAVTNNLFGLCHMAIAYGIETPILKDCWVFLPSNEQKWQSKDYDYGKVLNDILRNSCKPANIG